MLCPARLDSNNFQVSCSEDRSQAEQSGAMIIIHDALRVHQLRLQLFNSFDLSWSAFTQNPIKTVSKTLKCFSHQVLKQDVIYIDEDGIADLRMAGGFVKLDGSEYMSSYAKWQHDELVSQGNHLPESRLCKSHLEPIISSLTESKKTLIRL